MISIEEASKEIIEKHPEKNYKLDDIIKVLKTMGGEQFICSDELWECYGKKKLYNTLLRQENKI